ncbi:MAG: hypothetical protein QM660_11475 [Dysgonomonas sp.]
MKKMLLICGILAMFLSCSSNEDSADSPTLVGTWKLSEINNDPGDGSGVFQKVKSEKVLVFKTNNEITSNGSLCENDIESSSPSLGNYTVAEDINSSGKILPLACSYDFSSIGIHFEIKGSYLYVYYPCDELCAAKYVKQ